MISITFGKMQENPAADVNYKDEEPPEKCGYKVIDTVPWPATGRDTVKNEFAMENYPASAWIEGYREDQESPEHESTESSEYEKEEHT